MRIVLVTFLCLLSVFGFNKEVFAQALGDAANMKIVKARAGLLHLNKHNFQDQIEGKIGDINSLSAKVNCGSVEIGNTITTTGIGSDISLIITGDVINTGNRCLTLK